MITVHSAGQPRSTDRRRPGLRNLVVRGHRVRHRAPRDDQGRGVLPGPLPARGRTAAGGSRIPGTCAPTRRCCPSTTCRASGSRRRWGLRVRTQAFAEALAEAEKIIASTPARSPERDLAEGYDYLAGSVPGPVAAGLGVQRDFPYFVASTGPYTKMGLDNPDTLYFHAYLRDDARYVVTGRHAGRR